MNRFLRFIQVVGLNSVPAAGVLLGGWTDGTALLLYVFETWIAVVLVLVRIYVHRKATNKRGHYILVEVTKYNEGDSTPRMKPSYFENNFLLSAVVFSLIHVVFVLLIYDQAGAIDPDGFKTGLAISTAMLLAGLALDLVGIRTRSFAWLRAMANASLWRVFVIDIAVILGLLAGHFLGLSRVWLAVFVVLKLSSDLAYQLPEWNPKVAPAWSLRLFGRGYAEEFRAQREDDLRRLAEDEEPFRKERSRTPAYVNIRKGSAGKRLR